MAGESGRALPSLKDKLLAEPRGFSFFQAVRILRHLAGMSSAQDQEEFFRRVVRIRPQLSLGFPSADIEEVEEIPIEDGTGFRLTATFLGLYGSSSPLPTFYTEELLDEAGDDQSISRDFLDIFNDSYYKLFYQCWSKYRWSLKLFEEEHPDYLGRLYCLMGLGDEVFREGVPFALWLIRYLGLLTQFPRSAAGLKALISDAMGVPSVEIVPFLSRSVRIPEDQLCLLGRQGTSLGDDCYLGTRIQDRTSRIGIVMGPLDETTFRLLLPEAPQSFVLGILLNLYLHQPLECELTLVLDRRQARSARLGEDTWSSLGEDTWLFSSERPETDLSISFLVEQG